MISAADARAIELATLAATPPRERVEDDGWILAANGGAMGRANSVTPLFGGVDPIDAKIDRAIAFYRARGLGPAFRVSRFARPEGLSERLAARGFHQDADTSVETADAKDVAAIEAPLHEVVRTSAPSPDWLDVFLASSDEPATLQKLRLETLARAETSAFYSVRIDGQIAAVGVGAVDPSGFAGMHGMRTIQAARRTGCARAIVRAAALSALAQGATRLFLQVEVANAPARALYRALGFAQAYTYAYWR